MTDFNKYLKYKQKYLELKKTNTFQLAGQQFGGQRKVRTIGNDGRLDGMKLQCFWISILDYLRRNGHPGLSLRELRTAGGLDARTEQMMFDIDYSVDGMAIFYNAATQIAEIYNLRIQVYAANRVGEFALTDSPRGLIGKGAHLVELAQFGIAHFELIDAKEGTEFIPAVVVKGELKKVNTIDPIMIDQYLQLSECQGMLKILRDQSKVNSLVYERELKTKEELKGSQELSSDQKAIFLTQHEQFLNRLVQEINAIDTRIQRLQEEISSLMMIISEFESR